METSELRLGNWVKGENDPPMIVVAIEETFIQTRFNGAPKNYGDWQYDHRAVGPIPLTTDILKAAGFADAGSGWLSKDVKGGCLMPTREMNAIEVINDVEDAGFEFPCKYLHQLQNLYFSITGVELEIKQLSES